MILVFDSRRSPVERYLVRHTVDPSLRFSAFTSTMLLPKSSEVILIYGCITWTLTKRIGEKFDDNYTYYEMY